MRPGTAQVSVRKGSAQIQVNRGDSIISTFNQKSQQQKIMELQQRHKELRRQRREIKMSTENNKDLDQEAFEKAVNILYEKEKIIKTFEFQHSCCKNLLVFGILMIAKGFYNLTNEITNSYLELLKAIMWLVMLKIGKYYLLAYIENTIKCVQDEYNLEVQDLRNGLGVNQRDGSFKNYSSKDFSLRQDRSSLLGILENSQYNKIQSSIINNRTMSFKTNSQQMVDRDNSFKDNRNSISSFNTSSRRLITTQFKKPGPILRSFLDGFSTASLLEFEGFLIYLLVIYALYHCIRSDDTFQQNYFNHLILSCVALVSCNYLSLRVLFQEKSRLATHIVFLILFTRLYSIKIFIFDLTCNIVLCYKSDLKIKEQLDTNFQEFKKYNELTHKYGKYERIFRNMRSGYAILSYQIIHFQNDNFKKTLGIKQDSQVFTMLKQIKRRMRIFNSPQQKNAHQYESSGGPDKNNNQAVKFASVMEDLVNFLRNKPTVETNEDIEYYSEKVDPRTNQRFIRFFNITFQFILWDGQQKIQLTIKDITQDKKHLDNLLLQKLRNMMFKSFTHEIKTPLNGVIQSIDMSNEIIKQAQGQNQKSQTQNQSFDKKQFKNLSQYMNNIESGIYILQNTLNDLIDYQMIENGELKIHHKPFKLKECFDKIIKIIKPQILNPNVKFSFFFDQNVAVQMENDEDRIIRIALNLLLNAQKFTQKGFIKFSMKNVTLRRDALTPQSQRVRNSNYVRFEVQDSGLGIPDDKKPYIFNLFESDMNTLGNINQSTHQKSAKVGLPICQLLCQKLGGMIKVSSAQGEGSKFWFILPIAPKVRSEGLSNSPIGYGDRMEGNKNSLKIDEMTGSSVDHEEEKIGSQKYSSSSDEESYQGLPENLAYTQNMQTDNFIMHLVQASGMYQKGDNDGDDGTGYDEESSDINQNSSYLRPGQGNYFMFNPRRSNIMTSNRSHLVPANQMQREKSQFSFQTFNAINLDANSKIIVEELKNDSSPNNRARSNQRLSGSKLGVYPHQQKNSTKENNDFNMQTQQDKSYGSVCLKDKDYNGDYPSNHFKMEFLLGQLDQEIIKKKQPCDTQGMRQIITNSNFKNMRRPCIEGSVSEGSDSSENKSQSIAFHTQPQEPIKPFIMQNLNLNKTKESPEINSDRIRSHKNQLNFSNISHSQMNASRAQRNEQDDEFSADLTFSSGCECSQVLIVDDIDMNRLIITEILKRNFNLRSDQAINGAECISMVKEKQFSECCCFYKLIFMDYEMPIMNGIEASRKIKDLKAKNKIDSRTVIIGYTAYCDEEQNCLDSGMEFFLPKPASLDKIKACLVEIKKKLKERSRPSIYQRRPLQVQPLSTINLVQKASTNNYGNCSPQENQPSYNLSLFQNIGIDSIGQNQNSNSIDRRKGLINVETLEINNINNRLQNAFNDDSIEQMPNPYARAHIATGQFINV